VLYALTALLAIALYHPRAEKIIPDAIEKAALQRTGVIRERL
jgi:hypothetical protein